MFSHPANRRLPLRLLVLAALAAGALRTLAASSWSEPGLGAPLLRTFAVRETGTLGPYRCSLLTRDGRLYVAHNGLSVFDGETWRLLPLPAKSIVRALGEAPDGAIWIGGDNLLGRIVWLPGGVPEYRSALPQLPAEHQRDLGSVGAVFVSPQGKVVAVTENRVFELTGASARLWSLPAARRLAAWVDADGTLVVVRPGIETLRLTESGLGPTAFPTALATAGVDWAVHFDDGSSLVGADRHLIRLRDGEIEPLSGAMADLLREDRVVQAVRLPGGCAALATLRHGIHIVDAAGRRIALLEAPGDLPDNRVVHLAAGPGGRLVATTPEAIVVFNDTLRASVFDSRHGLSPKRVVALARNDRGLFAANDHRVLQLNTAEPAQPAGLWQPRAEEHEALTALLPWGASLLTASPSEFQLLAPDTPAHAPLRSAEVVAPCPWSAQPAGLAWIEDSRFCRGVLVDGRLVAMSEPVEIDHDACGIAEDAAGAHWIATAHAGVLRIAPLEQIRAGKPALRTYRENLRFTGNLTPRVFRVGPRILATNDNGLAVYSEVGDRFIPFPGLAGARIHAVAPVDADTAWLALSQRDRLPFQVNFARLRYSAAGLECDLAALPPLPFEEAPAALLAEAAPDSSTTTLWVGLNGRILRIATDPAPIGPPATPNVTALTLFDDDRGTRPLTTPQPRIAFDNAGLRFDIHVPAGRLGQRVHLETRLDELDPDWVPLGEIPSRVFRGLRDGSYRFEARAIDALGRPSPVATLTFSVQPPWWRSAPAYIAYALGLVLLSAFVFLTRLRLARAHRRELEALVAQRTRELAAASSAKSEFLAHINHEIRNPLNGVIGLSSMLANIHQDENARRLARSLNACAGYLASVVDNVLDLARIEAGRIEISPLRFDPRTLVEDVTEMFRLQIEEAGGRISWSADPELPAGLVGDVHRIRQVLVNFTANAARYARGGDVRLSVRRRTQSQNRLTVVFTVADTGPGIAPSEQERIFEKFSRGSSAAGEAPRGYGVGLALVRDLATLLGGEADVDSQVGYGAKFRLSVPLEIAPEPAVPAGPASGPANGLRVLVIDDQAFNRLVLRDHLERLGCKVEESADGTSAHLLLQARAHHVAFIDLDLPGLDGLALLRRMRSERDANPVFLVATTASATRGIQEQALAAGADAFLPKPISSQPLATLLRECSSRLAAAPAPALPASDTPAPSAGLFADIALTPDLIRSLHAELDVETQSLVSSWRLTDQAGARRHAHRIASLAIIARDTALVQAARQAEESLQSDRIHASRAVDALQSAARDRLRLLATTVSATGQDRKN